MKSVRAGLLGRAAVASAVLGLALWLTISAYAAVIAGGGGPYQTADWLISYAGGFTRRGLFGSIYLAIFPDGPAGLWVLFAVKSPGFLSQNQTTVPSRINVRALQIKLRVWDARAEQARQATIISEV